MRKDLILKFLERRVKKNKARFEGWNRISSTPGVIWNGLEQRFLESQDILWDVKKLLR